MVDRSIGLSDLAARAQSEGSSRKPVGRQRSDCRNPECRNGMTPGTAVIGGGKNSAPLFGAGGVGVKKTMRWAWVPCLACNAPDGARRAGAVYKNLNLSESDIVRRAAMADAKAPYTPKEDSRLSKPAGGRHVVSPPPGAYPSADAGRLDELAEQNKNLSVQLAQLSGQLTAVMAQNVELTTTLSRMSMQVAALLEDNAKLRAAQPGPVYASTVEAIQRTSGTLTLPEKKP